VKRLVVHVGLQRAGSTTIQRLLERRRDELAGHGVKVVLRGDLEALRPTPRLADLRRWTARSASTIGSVREATQVVISEENLLGRIPDHAHAASSYSGHRWALRALRLAETLNDVHVRWIVRRHDRLLESIYTFRVSGGSTEDFDSFAARVGPGLRWAGVGRAFAHSGLRDVRIRLFEDLFLDPSEARLGALLLLPGSECWTEPPPRGNAALPWSLSQALLYLNRAADLRKDERRPTRRALRSFATERELPSADELAHAFEERGVSRLRSLAESALSFAREQRAAAFTDEQRRTYLRSVADDQRDLLALPIVDGDRALWSEP